jgi:hypothetical protein
VQETGRAVELSSVNDAILAPLPPDATKDLTPRLIQTVAEAQSSPRGNPHLSMELPARYGDAESLPRIRAIYESQADKCQPELLAYFLRVDPAYGGRILSQALAPPCAMRYSVVTARLYMNPELEAFITALLVRREMDVQTAAAESLGKYGTATAEGPLWVALTYFHNEWKEWQGELKRRPEAERLELSLRNAIARGAGWLVTEADIRSIERLCLSDRCQYETTVDSQCLHAVLTVRISGSRASVAQYDTESLDRLENKLGQFPAGTVFQLRIEGPNIGPVYERLEQFGERTQLTFKLDAPSSGNQ